MKSSLFFAVFTAAIAANGSALAQEADSPCAAEAYRAFDFWAGEWEVFTPDGAKAGDNAITIEENGCLLVERWRGAQGGTGQSYNFYDPSREAWRQVWVSSGFVIDYQGGLNADDEMILEGTITYRDGRAAPFRGAWTALPGGEVRQHFEEQDAETGAWTPWFTGLYRPKE